MVVLHVIIIFFFFFKHKTAYELRISDWSSDVCSSDLDYLQGETVRIMYIHVPTAWLGMGGRSGIAISSIVFLVWRHPLASVAARAIAAPGAVFAGLCLRSEERRVGQEWVSMWRSRW